MPTSTQKLDTASLPEQAKAHEQAKTDHIVALLQERDDITAAHEKRLGEISEDLKALGYTKPRAPRTTKEKKLTSRILISPISRRLLPISRLKREVRVKLRGDVAGHYGIPLPAAVPPPEVNGRKVYRDPKSGATYTAGIGRPPAWWSKAKNKVALLVKEGK